MQRTRRILWRSLGITTRMVLILEILARGLPLALHLPRHSPFRHADRRLGRRRRRFPPLIQAQLSWNSTSRESGVGGNNTEMPTGHREGAGHDG